MVLGRIGPTRHEASPRWNDIAGSKGFTLRLQRILQVPYGDRIGIRQAIHALRFRHINESRSGDNRRIFIHARLTPSTSAKSVLSAYLIPNLPVQPEVIEG